VSKAAKGTAPVESPSSPAGGAFESVARKVYAAVATMIAAKITRAVIQRVWVRSTGKEPPEEPESPKVHWAEAVGWSALSGTSVAVARLLAARRAAEVWDRSVANSVNADGPTESVET
jgi:hypothetical protein